MNYKTAFLLTVSLLSFGTLQAAAEEKPPKNSMHLSSIVKSLEDEGYSPITEISFDDGVWEAEAYKNGQERKLKIDPLHAKILSDRPDD